MLDQGGAAARRRWPGVSAPGSALGRPARGARRATPAAQHEKSAAPVAAPQASISFPGTGIRGRNSHADEFAGLLLFLVSVIAAIIKSPPAAPGAAFPSRAACVLSRAAWVLSRAARVLAGGRAVVL